MLKADRSSLIALAILLFLAGCLVGFRVLLSPYLDPEIPRVEVAVGWKEVVQDELGVAFQIPQEFQAESGSTKEESRFSFQGNTQLSLVWIEQDTARNRGLWARYSPITQRNLGGRPAEYYLYSHFDAFAGVRVHAYVLPYQGKWLAMEFRTRKVSLLEDVGLLQSDEPELSTTDRQILDSFRFLQN